MAQAIVSAIVSAYKSEKFIRGCIEDLLSQTIYKAGGLEIVVIDSASPEDEASIVSELGKTNHSIKYLRSDERETLYGAWNRGIQLASGKYITNSNTDDRHREDALEILVDHLERMPEVDLCYSDALRTFEANLTFEKAENCDLFEYHDFFEPEVMLCYQFGCQPVWRREITSSVGEFDSSLEAAGDWDFNFRFNLAGRKAFHVRTALGLFYDNPNSLSLRDGRSANEQQLVRNRYFSVENVLLLYEKAGWDVDSVNLKTEALLDFARRCTNFKLPWVPGQVFADVGIAKLIVESAQSMQLGIGSK